MPPHALLSLLTWRRGGTMDNLTRMQLSEYYLRRGIHPGQFHCPHQAFCRSFAHQQQMTEAKMSMVGSAYGINYPKIVVVSLDPPGGQGDFGFSHLLLVSK